MKKVLAIIFVVIGIIAVVMGAIYGIFELVDLAIDKATEEKPGITGVIQKDGGEALYISELYTNSKYTVSCLFWENDGVMLSDQDNVRSSRITFTPQKSGHCIIFAEDYFCGDLEGVRIFDVTVDENLKISYAQRNTVQVLPHRRNGFGKDQEEQENQMTAQKDGNSYVIPKQTAIEIGNEFGSIYGTENDCSRPPDLSQCIKLTSMHENQYSYLNELYVSKDRVYYCDIWNEQEFWYEFIPDELFSLDGINELLDLKD